MKELTTYKGSLPALPDDLAKFIVVAQEKIKAVKAEIRAIRRLEMAKEVYDQKLAEQARLQELTLLAYQRMGEITREIPKDSGGRPQKTLPASGKSFESEDSCTKLKGQVIEDLGLSTSQVGRMEQMAAHPEIVDEVITESQTGQTEATQAEVLRRIKERKKVIDFADARKQMYDADMAQIDRDYGNLKLFRKAVAFAGLYTITDEILDSVVSVDSDLPTTVQDLNDLIGTVAAIRDKLIVKGAKHGKTNHHKRDQGSNL